MTSAVPPQLTARKAVLSTPVNAGKTRHASITQSSEAGSTVHLAGSSHHRLTIARGNPSLYHIPMYYSHHRRIFDIFYVKNPSKSTPNPKNVKPDTAIFYRVSLYDKTGFDLWLISGRTHICQIRVK